MDWIGPESLDQRLLCRVDILVLVNDQVPERTVNGVERLWTRELANRPRDDLPVGQESVFLERSAITLIDRAQRILELVRLESLVLDHGEVTEKGSDRLEQRPVQLLQADAIRFPRQEGSEAIVVENVERLVPRHMLLQDAETVRMDRPDEHASDHVQGGLPELRMTDDPPLDPRLERRRSSLGECERDDALRLDPVGEEFGDSLRDDFRLARPRRSDDLEVAAPVVDRGARIAVERWGFEVRRRHSSGAANEPVVVGFCVESLRL